MAPAWIDIARCFCSACDVPLQRRGRGDRRRLRTDSGAAWLRHGEGASGDERMRAVREAREDGGDIRRLGGEDCEVRFDGFLARKQNLFGWCVT